MRYDSKGRVRIAVGLAVGIAFLLAVRAGLAAGDSEEVFSVHDVPPISELRIDRLVDPKGKGKSWIGEATLLLEDGTELPLQLKKKRKKGFDEYKLKTLKQRGVPKSERMTLKLKLRTDQEATVVLLVKLVWFHPEFEKQKVTDPRSVRFGPRAPATVRLSGTIVTPDLEVEAGRPRLVLLTDLDLNEIAREEDSDLSFDFTVEPGRAYVVVVQFESGQVLTAVAPRVDADRTVEVSIDSETAANLIFATEELPDSLADENLSRPLAELLTDAEEAVERLNRFNEDRNRNRQADRLTEAVRSITLDRLNQGTWVDYSDLGPASLRAYGGGLDVQDVRSLARILSDPQIPLNPHFIFSRYNHEAEADFGMSNLDTRRWDLVGEWGFAPHAVPGGKKIVYVAPVALEDPDAPDPGALGVFLKTLGSRDEPVLLTSTDLDCWAPALSPDESRIVFSARPVEQIIYAYDGPESLPDHVYNLLVMNVDGTGIRLLTADENPSAVTDNLHGNLYATWHPDGDRLVYSHFFFSGVSQGLFEDSLEIIGADGEGRSTHLDGESSGYRFPLLPSWSPDGRRLLFECTPPGGTDAEIVVLEEHEGDLYATKLTDNAASDLQPAWSYDGRFVIFTSNRNGEQGTLPGLHDLFPMFVASSYTGEIVASLGDFTEAGWYAVPRFIGVEQILLALPEVETDGSGEAVVPAGQGDTRKSGSHSSYNYYREIIPAANSIGVTFATTSWFGG